MRVLGVLAIVGLLTAPLLGAPVWQADKTYTANANGPSQDNSPYEGYLLTNAVSGLTRTYVASQDGKTAWHDAYNGTLTSSSDPGRIEYNVDPAAFTMDPAKTLYFHWELWTPDNNDGSEENAHQVMGVEMGLDNWKFQLVKDGGFTGAGTFNYQNFTIIDGGGTIGIYTDRLLVEDEEWNTIDITMIPFGEPGNTDGGANPNHYPAVSISIDGVTGTTDGSNLGNNTKWAYGYAIKTDANNIKWCSAWSKSKGQKVDVYTHDIRWTQVPEPATLAMLASGGLLLIRRRRAA